MRQVTTTVISVAVVALLLAGCGGPDAPWHIERPDVLDTYSEADPRPVLVVDLDDTVVRSGFWNSLRLALRLWYSSVDPFPDAPETLRELAARWRVVFLTARSDAYAAPTMAWIEAHGFPAAPVVFSSGTLWTSASRQEYKSRALAFLSERGLAPLWGIGDKASDIHAYADVGARAALILDGHGDADLATTLESLGAATLRNEGPLPPPLEIVVFSQTEAWPLLRRTLP